MPKTTDTMSNNNDWGVYQENTTPVLWLHQEDPIEWSSEDQAKDDMSESYATTLAGDLTNGGTGSFAPGRPKRKPPVHS